MRLAIVLVCCAVALGQNGSPSPETKSQNSASPASDQRQQSSASASPNSLGKYGANMSAGAAIQQAAQAAANHSRNFGGLDILSDTKGVNFGPYLQDLVHTVRENWHHLIPESDEMKKGKLAIELAITKEGQVADMRLVASSGDVALDRPAWGSITASNPFKPLPNEFTGPYLALRMRFYYNPDKSELAGSSPEPAPPTNEKASLPSKSGITVSISSSGDVYVAAGKSRAITTTVTGTQKQALKWSVTGLGCSKSSCGKMAGNLYVAPSVPPTPPVVTLTAISKADHTAKASVRIHIVQP